jgi:hypothetical protein
MAAQPAAGELLNERPFITPLDGRLTRRSWVQLPSCTQFDIAGSLQLPLGQGNFKSRHLHRPDPDVLRRLERVVLTR